MSKSFLTSRKSNTFKYFSNDFAGDPQFEVDVSPNFPSPFNLLSTAVQYVKANFPTASFATPVLIRFATGRYEETLTSSILLTDGIFLDGAGIFSSKIILKNPTAAYPFITQSGLNIVSNLNFSCETFTSVNTPINYNNILWEIVSGGILMENLAFAGGNDAIINSTANGVIISQSGILQIGTTIDFFDFFVNPADWLYTTFGAGIRSTGFACTVSLGSFPSFTDVVVAQQLPPPFTKFTPDFGCELTNAIFICEGADFTGLDVSISITSCTARITGGTNETNRIGVDINTSEITLLSNICDGNTLFDLSINDDTSQVSSIACQFELNKIILPVDTSNLSLNFYDENVDDEKGIHQLGNLIIGDITFPSKTYLGEGSSNIQQLSILKFDGVSTYTDVSDDLIPSSTGINVTLFDTLTAGNILYIGNGKLYTGIRSNIVTALDYGVSGDIVKEYWNGSAWATLNIMSTDGFSPYSSVGGDLWSAIREEDMRYNNLVLNNFVQVAVDGITKFWVRFRITATITTSPVLNWIKIYGNTSVIDINGAIQYYGNARPRIGLAFDTSYITASGATAPVSQTLYASKNLFVIKDNNQYRIGDIGTFSFFQAPNIDSSTPIVFEFAFASNSATATQSPFNMEIIFACITEAEILYNTSAAAPATIPLEQTILFSLTPNQTDGRTMVIDSVEIPIETCIASSGGQITETLLFKLSRVTDVNGGRINFLNLSPYATQYSTGLII